MKTQVETFEIEDVKTESIEQSAEALAIIKSLGLKGQMPSLDSDLTETTIRFPYRRMTDEENFIYSFLCPERSKLEDYSNGPIPLEVLKTAAFARSLNDSKLAYLEVWSAASAQVKDPVLVGRANSYTSDCYILARWGEELLPLAVLLPDAIKVWWEKRVDKLNEMKATIELEITKSCPLSRPVRGTSEPYMSV